MHFKRFGRAAGVDHIVCPSDNIFDPPDALLPLRKRCTQIDERRLKQPELHLCQPTPPIHVDLSVCWVIEAVICSIEHRWRTEYFVHRLPCAPLTFPHFRVALRGLRSESPQLRRPQLLQILRWPLVCGRLDMSHDTTLDIVHCQQ